MLSARQQHCLDRMGITRWKLHDKKTLPREETQTAKQDIPAPLPLPDKPVLVPASAFAEQAEKRVILKNYDLDNWADTQLAIEACKNCELAESCTRKVPGKGNAHADLMIIGEAPGQDEDIQGLPFVGRAGQLLDRILSTIGLNSQDVFITNILKCRPPNNRDPKIHESDACAQFLYAQIKLIKPKIILSVGRISAQTLLKDSRPLGQLRSTLYQLPNTEIPLLVTYHPAYLLRNPAEKAKVWHDIKILQKQLQA